MPSRQKAHRRREPENDREFEKLLRVASRLQRVSRPVLRLKAVRGKSDKPKK
ncbi:MAG TPA: hypothetical protein VIH46_02835 [Candidatus Acidoferrales bacterium]|jgi:hypothetical protein